MAREVANKFGVGSGVGVGAGDPMVFAVKKSIARPSSGIIAWLSLVELDGVKKAAESKVRQTYRVRQPGVPLKREGGTGMVCVCPGRWR